MSVAKIIEISSSSTKGFEDAISQGIARASETIKHIQGAWVSEQKVVVEKGKVVDYRVTLRLIAQLNSSLAAQGVTPDGGSPAVLRDFITSQMTLWKRVIDQHGIKAE